MKEKGKGKRNEGRKNSIGERESAQRKEDEREKRREGVRE